MERHAGGHTQDIPDHEASCLEQHGVALGLTFTKHRKNFGPLFLTAVVIPYVVLLVSRKEEMDHDKAGTAAHGKKVHQYF